MMEHVTEVKVDDGRHVEYVNGSRCRCYYYLLDKILERILDLVVIFRRTTLLQQTVVYNQQEFMSNR